MPTAFQIHTKEEASVLLTIRLRNRDHLSGEICVTITSGDVLPHLSLSSKPSVVVLSSVLKVRNKHSRQPEQRRTPSSQGTNSN